jgi:hypothetical protein
MFKEQWTRQYQVSLSYFKESLLVLKDCSSESYYEIKHKLFYLLAITEMFLVPAKCRLLQRHCDATTAGGRTSYKLDE